MSTEDMGQAGSTDPVFRTVKRGFDPEQVLDYLRSLSERVQGLEGQLERAQRDLSETRRRASEPTDPYEGVSAHVAALLRGFDEEVERARAKAEADAGRIQAEAKAKADLEIEQVRGEAERLRLEQERLRNASSEGLRSMRDHMARSLLEIEAALGSAPPDSPGGTPTGTPTEGPVMVLPEDDERAAAGISVPNPPTEAG
jgi:cell division septum initiation protein DivIVA